MKPPYACVRGALLAAALASFTVLAIAADTNGLGQAAGVVPVPAGLTASQVQNAIIMALNHRGWTVNSRADDRVVGYLKHRSNEATLTLIYTTGTIELYCEGWQIDKRTGVREKPEQPRGWLKYIKEDLVRDLNLVVVLKQ
jgi:hypothetical protein